MKHVYLGSLPIGTEFLHKVRAYKKTDEEHAKDFNGKEWIMEPHLGAVITLSQYKLLKLDKKDEINNNENSINIDKYLSLVVICLMAVAWILI